MELICPACEARYQLPQGSIGEKGRQVSCMNCGHHWHAYPPLMLGGQIAPAPVAPDQSPPSGIRWSGPSGAAPAAPVQSSAAPHPAAAASGHQPVEMSAGGVPQMPTGGSETSRTEQLAEIRQMLADVQSDERAPSYPVDDGRTRIPGDPSPSLLNPDTAAEQAAMRLAEERAGAQLDAMTSAGGGGEDEDDLRRRIDQISGREQAKTTDVKKIRRKHDRRVKRKIAASSAGSGAFMTGFLLIAIIASVMVALYVLKPQIVAQMPDAEGPMTKYVATMDSLRVQVADLFYGVRDWVVERFADKI